MQTNRQIKNDALTHLSGNWGTMAIMTLLLYIILGFTSLAVDYATLEPLGSLVTILLLPISYGFNVVCLNLKRTDRAEYNHLWEGFTEYFPVLFTLLLKTLYILLWSLLLIVPGIMKTYSYAMTEFVMKDNPDLRYDKAIEKSMELMQGHKMQLFKLDLSMIGWAILSLCTLGIGYLFLVPYNLTAHAEFYDELLRLNGEDVKSPAFDKYSNL